LNPGVGNSVNGSARLAASNPGIQMGTEQETVHIACEKLKQK